MGKVPGSLGAIRSPLPPTSFARDRANPCQVPSGGNARLCTLNPGRRRRRRRSLRVEEGASTTRRHGQPNNHRPPRPLFCLPTLDGPCCAGPGEILVAAAGRPCPERPLPVGGAQRPPLFVPRSGRLLAQASASATPPVSCWIAPLEHAAARRWSASSGNHALAALFALQTVCVRGLLSLPFLLRHRPAGARRLADVLARALISVAAGHAPVHSSSWYAGRVAGAGPLHCSCDPSPVSTGVVTNPSPSRVALWRGAGRGPVAERPPCSIVSPMSSESSPGPDPLGIARVVGCGGHAWGPSATRGVHPWPGPFLFALVSRWGVRGARFTGEVDPSAGDAAGVECWRLADVGPDLNAAGGGAPAVSPPSAPRARIVFSHALFRAWGRVAIAAPPPPSPRPKGRF